MEEINSRSVLLYAESKNRIWNFLNCYVVKPIAFGILGFLMFLSVLAITKFLGCCLGTIKEFFLETDDLLLSMLGFVFVFLIKFLKNFRDKES